MANRALVLTGICITTVGGLGFFTYADDLQHAGELATAFGLVLSGITLLASALQSTLRLHWLSVVVLVGLLVGSALDEAALGLAGGIAIGALATWWRYSHGAKAHRPL